jgi:hypothetical protein
VAFIAGGNEQRRAEEKQRDASVERDRRIRTETNPKSRAAQRIR